MKTYHERQLVRTRIMLDRAATRDSIQAERPDTCDCLGYGGLEENEIILPSDEDGELFLSFNVYCSCADGQEAKRQAALHMERVRAWRVRVAIATVDTAVTSAGMSTTRTFESYLQAVAATVGYVPDENARVVHLLRSWCTQSESWLYLHGVAGTGKTSLVTTALMERAKRGEGDIVIVPVTDLLDTIKATFNSQDASTEEVLDRYRKAAVLFIDDIGHEYPTPWAVTALWDLINTRYRFGRLTVFTSNDQVSKVAAKHSLSLVDRLTDKCLQIELNSPVLRGR